MNKGICFHFGYVYENLNIKQQARDIKNAGFDCAMTTADPTFNKENRSINHQVKVLKANNLKLSSLHMRYKKEELPFFWQDCKIGDKIEKNIIKDVKIAHKYGFTCVVVHLYGEANEIGFSRLKRILKYCEKYNIPLALENLNKNNKLLDATYKNIKSDYLKFCYDAGHAHAFEPEIDHLTKYKDKVITLHLHDNLGPNVPIEKYEKIGYFKTNPDMHTLNKYGNIKWNEIAKKLALLDRDINLDYEILMCYRKNETPIEVLEETYKQACKLEKLILKYKKEMSGK